MLINKSRTQKGLKVLFGIVIIVVTMDIKNLKFISTTEACTSALRSCPTLQKSGDLPLITYSHDELVWINKATKHDQSYKTLPFGTIRAIRSSKLNHKKVKNNKQHKIMQTGVNPCNLIQIQITKSPAPHDHRLKISTVNTQSSKQKGLQVMELVSDHNLDFVVITETWLTNNQSDNIWLEGTCLNKDHLRMLKNNRVGSKGGGIALIYKKEYSVQTTKMAPSHHFNIQFGL